MPVDSKLEGIFATVWRYIRLYFHFLRFSVSRSMEFRVDFWLRVLMDLFYYASYFVFFGVVFEYTDTMAGWTKADVNVFIAIGLVIDGMYMTFLSNNFWDFPRKVNKGDVDYYLLRPVSPAFFLCLRDFAFNSFINLLCSLVILVWALSGHPQEFGWGDYFLLILVLANGFVLYSCLGFLMLLPVFWTGSGDGLRVLWLSMMKFSEKPDRIYTGVMRVVLTFLIPMTVMISFPTRIFLEPFDLGVVTVFVLVSGFFYAVTYFCWNRALAQYSSASS